MVENEKRQSLRYQGSAGGHIVYLEGSARIKDISVHGIYVLDEEPLPVGEKIRFTLRHGTTDIPIEGTVVRTEEKVGMAIQFNEMSREAARRLKIYISSLGPQVPAPSAPGTQTPSRR